MFACGDAHANPLKQIAMAVGEGALAAVQARALPRRRSKRPAGLGAPATAPRPGRNADADPGALADAGATR